MRTQWLCVMVKVNEEDRTETLALTSALSETLGEFQNDDNPAGVQAWHYASGDLPLATIATMAMSMGGEPDEAPGLGYAVRANVEDPRRVLIELELAGLHDPAEELLPVLEAFNHTAADLRVKRYISGARILEGLAESAGAERAAPAVGTTQRKPERYWKLTEPFDSEAEFTAALDVFVETVGQARIAAGIPDLSLVAMANVMDRDGKDSGQRLTMMHLGDDAQRVRMLAYALGRAQGEQAELLGKLTKGRGLEKL